MNIKKIQENFSFLLNQKGVIITPLQIKTILQIKIFFSTPFEIQKGVIITPIYFFDFFFFSFFLRAILC